MKRKKTRNRPKPKTSNRNLGGIREADRCIGWKRPNGEFIRCDEKRVGPSQWCYWHAPYNPRHLIDGEPLRRYADVKVAP